MIVSECGGDDALENVTGAVNETWVKQVILTRLGW